jgi:hypothetical protein
MDIPDSIKMTLKKIERFLTDFIIMEFPKTQSALPYLGGEA